MAAVRPLVLVYQELADTSTVAETPTLETLIAGPAYHLQDYPADSDDIQVSDYGSRDAASSTVDGSSEGRPATNSEALILSDPPNNVTGGILDQSSVVVYLVDALLEIEDDIAGEFGTATGDENKFTSTNTVDLDAAGVKQGDRLVVTTGNSDTYTFIVQEVGDGSGSLTTSELRTTTNFTDSGNETGLAWRVERELDDPVELSDSYFSMSDNEITINGGVKHLIDINDDGVDESLFVNHAEIYVQYRALRTDLAKVTQIDEQNLETELGVVDERNPLAAGAQIALDNTTTSIQVWGVDGDDLNGESTITSAYSDMTSLLETRDDIYAIVPLTRNSTVVDSVHQHAETFSTPEKGKFRAVYANIQELPLEKTISGPSTGGTAEENGGDSVSVLAWGSETFETDGVRAGDEFALVGDAGSGRDGSYTVDKVLGEERIYATDLAGVTAEAADAQHYVLRNGGVVDRTVPAVSGGGTVTGADTVELASGEGDANDVGKVIRLSGVPGGNTNEDASPVGNNDYLITGVSTDTYTVVGPGLSTDAAEYETQIINTVDSLTGASEVTTRNAYRRLLDNNASFSSNGVIATDLLEIPMPPASNGTDFEDAYQAEIESVISENRIQLVEGSDIPTLQPDTPQTDIGYQVLRNLSKEGQKDELLITVDEQTGYNSKRLVLVWPDEVLLSNVQNTQTQTKSRQPGYFLACALGGMSAGLPPHQGFTYLGINGIDQIYHSSRYFSDEQLTDISNSGHYLFVQETTNQLPYSMHQLTTDTSNLQNSEVSLVRDFDYVSRFFKDIVDDFIGRYNVTPQTLGLMSEALKNGADQLESDSLPRIGAPLLGSNVRSVEIAEGTRDRVEIYMDLDFPAPLNRVGLHLVA